MSAAMPAYLRDLAAQMSEYGRGSADANHMYDAEIEAALRAAADEVSRLCALIQNTPHNHECHMYLTWYERERRCTCWKADAL